METLRIILYTLYVLQLKASRLCVYECGNNNFPHYCTSEIELCDTSHYYTFKNITKLCPLYGYQNIHKIDSCESYANKEYNYSLWCLYKCSNDDYPNFCVETGQVCPQRNVNNCPIFYVPQWFNNIEECNNDKNNTIQITSNNIVSGFKITKQSALTLNSSNISNNIAIITFYVNYAAYQCEINLLSSDINYYCDTLNILTTECNKDELNGDIPSYGIQIDSNINVEIESLFMMTNNLTTSIEYFCFVGNEDCLINETSDTIIINELNPSIYLTFTADINDIGYVSVNNVISTPYCAEVSPILFGFETSKSWSSGSDGKITMTLTWGVLKYQCTIYATDTDSIYSCNTINILHTHKCNTSIEQKTNLYGLQIENENDNGLRIDNVWIEITKRNISYQIDYFCFNISINYSQLITYESTYFVENVCLNRRGYDAVFIDSAYYSYLKIHLTRNDVPHEANAYIMDEPSVCFSGLSRKYILVNQRKNWMDAQNYCINTFNSSLATIITDEDMRIAISIKKEKYDYVNPHSEFGKAWIGLTDMFEEGNWIWIDGTSCDYAEDNLCQNDIRWADGEPNNYKKSQNDEDCAVLIAPNWFNDFDCELEYIFFCNNNNYTEYTTTTISNILTTEENVGEPDLSIEMIIILCFCILITVFVIGGVYLWRKYRIKTNEQQEEIVELKSVTASLTDKVEELQNEFSSMTGTYYSQQESPEIDNLIANQEGVLQTTD